MKVRLATWRDRDAILRLVVQMGGHDDVGVGEDPMRRLGALLRDPDARVLVAERDGAVIGFADVQARASSVRDAREAWLGALAIAPGERGRGAGSALLDAVDTVARELGCTRIELESSSSRERSHRFYLARGYERQNPAERFERIVPPLESDDIVERFLAASARAASAVQNAIVGLGDSASVGMGADGAPTEAADRAAEDAVLSELAPLGITIVSEERGTIGSPPGTGDFWIVIDPLDGSRNFRAGYPPYATAMGLVRDGIALAGFVCELTSMRRWWSDGRNAFADGRSIAARRGTLVGYPSPLRDAPIERLGTIPHRVRVSGSTATDLCRIADGSLAAFVGHHRAVTHVHDLAGPLPILIAAGGVVIDVATGTTPLLVPDPTYLYRLIAAADEELARAFLSS